MRSDGSEHVQDDREQKREKRKQANRESARRSRMRKQVLTSRALSEGFDSSFVAMVAEVGT